MYFKKYFVTQIVECNRSGRKITTEAPELHPIPVVSLWYHIGIGPISPPSVRGVITKFVEAMLMESKHADGMATSLFKVCKFISVCTW